MNTGLEEETTRHDVKKETQQHEAVKKENGIINDRLPPNFPDGLRVMVIDDDHVFLQHMDKLLKELLYQVTTYNGAAVPLSTLRAERNNFDIAFCSLHLANKDGFKLLKQILTEMDIPVVMMMSSEDNNDIVIKCLTEGAYDCLIKPIERKDIQHIFKHVIRKMMVGHSNGTYACECHQKSTEKSDFSATVGNSKRGRKRITGEVINKVEDSNGVPTAKKTRVVWTDELNRKFNAVVEKIGIDKAVPKKILELMNVPGLTRENVASHLQKHRLSHRKTQGYPECNPNTLINQPEALLAPLSLEESVNHQYFNKFQNHGAMGGQLGRSTCNALDPSLNNGRFRQDYSNFVAKHGYMPHQSPMRGHRLSPLMGQQMLPNGQDNNVRAPVYNPYYGGDPRTDYRAAGFPQNYPSMDSTFDLPNFSMIEMSHPNSIDESCMKWKHPPYAGSHLDASNSMYPPSAIDPYSLHNSQKNNHGHSDIIILSHHNDQHHESLTGAHLLKPPGIEGAEPKSETTFEASETNFGDHETKSDE